MNGKNKKTAALGRLLSYTKPYSGYIAAAVAAALLQVAAALLTPVIIGRAIDNIVGAGEVDFQAVLRDVIIIIALVLIGSAFQLLLSRCTNAAAFNTVRDIRTELFAKLNRLPLKYIDSVSHGDIMSRVGADTDLISDGLLQGFSQLFTGVVTILGTLFLMLSLNKPIALIVILLTPLSLFVAAFIGKRAYGKFREQAVTRGELSGLIEEYVGNQQTVRSFGQEKSAQTRFDEINSRLYTCGVKAQFYSAMSNPSTRFVNGLVYAAVGVFGALAAIGGGGITVGQLSCFLSYANQYTKPFNEITGVLTEFQNAMSSAVRVFAVMDETEEESDEALPPLEECDCTVDIENVCFSYRPDVPLIEDLSLRVSAGRRVAIVGPTGCGKTTLINLLMRFYDVDSGSIEVSGVDIRGVKRSSLRGSYGMVLQESWLFGGTVRENIAYGRPDATDAEITEAAKKAHAHGFIKRMKNGYDTVITEDGGNLSQGQKQLLCIARIMLTKPPMLILDEATSSIDTRTELKIQDAFAKIMQGRTCFIVAHRLSTIREADVILVMRDGAVVEQGTHAELLAKNGFYAELSAAR